MSFLASPVSQARKPFAEVLPDGRKRLTRYFKVNQTSSNVPVELDYAVKTADPWPDAPTGWTGLLLTYKRMPDEQRGFPQGAEDSKPVCELVFEQISATGETQTGGTPQTQLPDGRMQVEFTYVMFSSSTYTPQDPGTTTAPSPFTSYYLWEETNEDDGTLRNIKRVYQTAGTTATDDESKNEGALLIKRITSFKTVPSTPAGYTLVGSPVQNPNGYPIYTYTFVKGDGNVSTEVQGQSDGALVYTVVDFRSSATTPSYPGSGTGYLIDLDQKKADGHYINTAVWKKPPETVTFKKQVNFTKPGSVVFTGSPPQLLQRSQVTMTLLADAEVSYSTAQATTTPFTVESYAAYYASWIPYANPGTSPTPGTPPADPTTSPPKQETISFGGYLAGASGISGTDDFFNGVFCQEYSATLASSTPSSFAVPDTYTLSVDNDPYLTDTSGTVVFRRTVVTYPFT